MPKGKKKNKLPNTPTFHAAMTASNLNVPVQEGLEAVDSKYRGGLAFADTRRISGSVDMDSAFQRQEAQSYRWDYGIGLRLNGSTGEVAFWVEPHSPAAPKEVSVMVEKHRWLKDKLTSCHDLNHLTDRAKAAGIPPYIWITQGVISVISGTKYEKQLAQAGITLPKRRFKFP